MGTNVHKLNRIIVFLLVTITAFLFAGCAEPSARLTPVISATPANKSIPPTVILTPAGDNGTGDPGLIATVTVKLVAQNNAFDMDLIRVVSGDVLSVVLENRDNTDHNFALYENAESRQPIFKGKAITGPGTITYTFKVPANVNYYYFQCDFHPATMNGQFFVAGYES